MGLLQSAGQHIFNIGVYGWMGRKASHKASEPSSSRLFLRTLNYGLSRTKLIYFFSPTTSQSVRLSKRQHKEA